MDRLAWVAPFPQSQSLGPWWLWESQHGSPAHEQVPGFTFDGKVRLTDWFRPSPGGGVALSL